MDGNWATIQNSSSSAQIYAFGLGQSFGAKPETMMKHTINLYGQVAAELRPNVVLTVDQKMLAPGSGEADVIQRVGLPGRYFCETRK